MDIIVFEGTEETIVGAASAVNKLVEDWFLNAERNLDDYDIYLVDGNQGMTVVSRTSVEAIHRSNDDFDIIDLMPNVMREALIKKGLLTDEDAAA